MKTAHLVRHAESERAPAGVHDHDRVLTTRGRTAAGRLGDDLRESGSVPDLVLCSTARRARETLERMGLPEAEHHFDRGLYEATGQDLLERLRKIADTVDDVLLVGHNPAVHRLATMLAGSGNDRERLEREFPAGALATVAAPVESWTELGPGAARLVRLVVPEALE